jgi:Domain of unknown function (DUF5666)
MRLRRSQGSESSPVAVANLGPGWQTMKTLFMNGAGLRPSALPMLIFIALLAAFSPAIAAAPQQASAPSSFARPVGTIKAISGNTITLATDAGEQFTISVQTDTSLLRIAPGQKDLKNATPIQLQDLQPGDRILVAGLLSGDSKSVVARRIIAVKESDVAARQARDLEEWRRHGVGGLVKSVDPTAGTVTISVLSFAGPKDLAIHTSKQTLIRRYAQDSVKFDDARPGTLAEIKEGDQLRARGARSVDGNELTADEIVSGTFRNIAGTILSVDPAANTLTVMDLATKKPVTVKFSSESQLRKLPPFLAQRIAMRLKGTPSEAPQGEAPSRPATTSQVPGAGRGPGGAGGGPPDLQQMMNRLPSATLADLQKGEAVMIVTTEGAQGGTVTAINLLAGVEPILEASPNGGQSTILSPWSLGGAPTGEGATP